MLHHDADHIFVPNGYPAHLIIAARAKADTLRRSCKAAPREDVEHLAVIRFLDQLAQLSVMSQADYWWTPNEGRHIRRDPRTGKVPGADLGAAARDRAKGLRSGVADIIIAVPGEVVAFTIESENDAEDDFVFDGFEFAAVAIELKRARRSLSKIYDEQREWLAARRRHGWIAEVCFGAAEALELIAAVYG